MVIPSRSAAIAFACSACGRCCNTPPRLSLPELFRFEQVFVGCLSITRLSADGHAGRLALLDRIAVRAPGPTGTTHIAVTPQGYGYDTDAHCPALAADGGCSLQATDKPVQCAAVPADPMLPDSLQDRVLRERMGDAAFADAGCLVTGAAAGPATLTRGASVVDAQFAAALAARRQAMADDTNFWGRSVLAALPRQFVDVPPGAYLALPVSSALLVVAGISDACRQRCIGFIDAQLRLIDLVAQRARTRRRREDRPTTQRLLSWADDYRGLRRLLASPPASWMPAQQAYRREAWLGLAGDSLTDTRPGSSMQMMAMA